MGVFHALADPPCGCFNDEDAEQEVTSMTWFRVALLAILLILPATAAAEETWQPTWRFTSGALALGSGAALVALSAAWGSRCSW